MKLSILIVTILSIILSVTFVQNKYMKKTSECENLIPNKKTAIKIAEAVWLPIYGEAIYNKRPFSAELVENNIWKVKGTLKKQKGGVPYIELQKCDCKVIKVSHSK